MGGARIRVILSIAVASAVTLAAWTPAGSAMARAGETDRGVCDFTAQATIEPGISGFPRHNTFDVNSTQFQCVSPSPWLNGSFDVHITGTSTGSGLPGGPAGETCADGYSAELAQLSLVNEVTGQQATGQLAYYRVGTQLSFWGAAQFADGGPAVIFQGESISLPQSDSPSESTILTCFQQEQSNSEKFVEALIKGTADAVVEHIAVPVAKCIGEFLVWLIGLLIPDPTTSTTSTTTIAPFMPFGPYQYGNCIP